MSARKTGSGHSPEMAKSDFAGSSEPRQYVPESESDSDEHVPCVDVVAGSGSARRSQVIHSGHFMVSSPHSDSVKRRDPALNRHDGFNTASKPDGQKYWFGPLSSKRLTVDPSLTTLFECMTLAYSGKIVSPKWKSFKGLRLLWRDKIRLNNGIWRAWFIQYVEKRKNPVCGFITPLDGSEAEAHGKPQAIVLEGSYWKRQIEVVTKEYHKWRIYYKKRLQKNKDLLSMLKSPIDRTGLEKWTSQMYVDPETRGEEVHMFDLDCFLSDISDTLFTMTQKPSPWSEDWQNSYTSNADMIQPGLTPLQPNLDDLMDIPDIFLSFRGPQSDLTGYSDFSFCDSFSDGMFPSTASSALSTPMMHSSSLLTESLSEKGFPQACISLIPPGTSFSRQNMIPDMTFNRSANFSHSTAPYDPPESLGTQTKEVPAFMPHESSYPVPSLLQYKQSSSQSQNSMATMAAVITHTGSPLSSECTGMSGSYSSGLSQRFLLPQRMDVVTGKGKCKQKSVGVGTAMTSPKAPPTQTSCLTNLLTSISQEQKSQNFDAAASTGYKTRRPVSPLSPLQPNSSSGRGSQLSHNPPWGQVTSLLIPKTEQLSPVQMPDRLALPGPFSGSFRQTSPTYPPEKNPEAFSGPLKIDAGRDEPRRITHISAEQKRRFNIKLGFDTLQGLVSTLSSQPSVKISKALTLQKTAEYISKMQHERAQLHDEAQRLREQIQHLNAAINVCQQQLPATGVPITRQRFHHMREKFREYVRTQTLQDWKFWIFSLMIEPLFESFNSVVSTSSVEDLCGSSLSWLEQHCSLLALRPAVLSSLRLLSTSTSILSDPSLLPEQAIQAANHRPLSPSYNQ